MLLLLDLDQTLLDRDGAFLRWAQGFVAGREGTAADVEWLVRADAAGQRPRSELVAELKERFGLAEPDASILQSMRDGIVHSIGCYDGVVAELDRLKQRGARLVIVTNGDTAQQKNKILRAGLDRIVDAAIISDEVGVAKPDGRIFELALAGASAKGAWMVGDNPISDIFGAQEAGISTGWVSHGEQWTKPWLPDVSGETTVEVLRLIESK